MFKTKSKALISVMLFFSVSAIVSSLVSNIVYKVNYHFNQLNLYVKNDDQQGVRSELYNLGYFYGLSRTWKMDWLANKYLFYDFERYELAHYFTMGDYKKIEESSFLKSSDDYRDLHMIGVAKFLRLQSEYKQEKDQAVKNKIIERVVEEVNPYFKRAVENSPTFAYPDPNFDDRINYDITSTPEMAKRFLEAQLPGPRFILGIPNGGKDDGDKEVPGGERRYNEETKPGSGGNPQKKG